MRHAVGNWLVRQGWALRYQHHPPHATPPYSPPGWWQFHASMYLVRLGGSIHDGTVLRDRWVWWARMARELVIMLIPRTVKDRIKRRIRGW